MGRKHAGASLIHSCVTLLSQATVSARNMCDKCKRKKENAAYASCHWRDYWRFGDAIMQHSLDAKAELVFFFFSMELWPGDFWQLCFGHPPSPALSSLSSSLMYTKPWSSNILHFHHSLQTHDCSDSETANIYSRYYHFSTLLSPLGTCCECNAVWSVVQNWLI